MTVKNPNSIQMRIKKSLLARWSECDTPTSEPRFRSNLFAKDLAIFIILPIATVFIFKIFENALNAPPVNKRQNVNQTAKNMNSEISKSQIIDFKNAKAGISAFNKRSTGTLVKVKLLNVVETYGNAPVHAQVIDMSLGNEWFGATFIGDATGDTNFDRININFSRLRSSKNQSLSLAIKARALSLNGSLGLEAIKKEGFFARSALNSANPAANSARAEIESSDLKSILAKALASGLLQEFGNSATVERNRSQVLTLSAGEVFYVELTDDFSTGNNHE